MNDEPVLVATDFSPGAERAIERAAQLAGERKTSLHLLHVLPALSWKAFGKALVEHPLVTEKQLYDSAKARLSDQADACARRHGIPVVSHVDIGQAHDRIAGYARIHAAGLTVLGAHAGNPLRDLFIGTTALKILRKTARPALVAVSGAAEPYRRILVAADFSDASRAALEFAARFAPHATIHVLHVYDVPYEGMMHYAGVEPDIIEHYRHAAEGEAQRLLHEFLADATERSRAFPVVEHGSPARTVLEHGERLQADLIVMGKKVQPEIDDLVLGSVTESVLYRLDRDLLLVPGG